MDNKFIKDSNLSLEDLENSNSEILNRIAADLNEESVNMSHSSHSSSSGRGHSSYVSGSSIKKEKK